MPKKKSYFGRNTAISHLFRQKYEEKADEKSKIN
jgi:hypothetical protein